MKYLIDTHAFLWFYNGSPLLPLAVRKIVENPENETFLSVASIWEMAIKVSTGKLVLNMPIEKLIDFAVSDGFLTLPVHGAHALGVSKMAFHHKDPFDRLLIAQSLAYSMPMLSTDVIFDEYGVNRVWEAVTAFP